MKEHKRQLWHWYLDIIDWNTYAISDVWMKAILYINMDKKDWEVKGRINCEWKTIFKWYWNEEEISLEKLMEFLEDKAEEFYQYLYIDNVIKSNNK